MCVCVLLCAFIYAHTQNEDSFKHLGNAEPEDQAFLEHILDFIKKEEEKVTCV